MLGAFFFAPTARQLVGRSISLPEPRAKEDPCASDPMMTRTMTIDPWDGIIRKLWLGEVHFRAVIEKRGAGLARALDDVVQESGRG